MAFVTIVRSLLMCMMFRVDQRTGRLHKTSFAGLLSRPLRRGTKAVSYGHTAAADVGVVNVLVINRLHFTSASEHRGVRKRREHSKHCPNHGRSSVKERHFKRNEDAR